MKKLFYLAMIFAFAIKSQAQKSDSIFLGKRITIYSKVLNENRKVWIYTPSNTSINVDNSKRYPVLYLLDGDAHFFSAVGIVQQLSQANGNGVLPEMIIVAVENTNRLRDLTPALPPSANLDKANPFNLFLHSELVPYVDKNFNTAPYKVIAGHSLGGLTVINMMNNHPQLFNAYIAIDPSMWYKNEAFLNDLASQLPQRKLNGTKLYIGVANTMPKGMSQKSLKDDKSVQTQHIRSIFKLDQVLKSNNIGLKYGQCFYEKESHNTVPLLSLYDGLKFIFDFYLFDVSENEFTDSSAVIAQKLKKHYTNISNEMGYKVAAPEAFVNYLGYDAMSKKQFNKAEALFKLNLDSYPSSSNAYDSYADYLITQKDTVAAMAFYKKAIAIKEDPLTVAKLNALSKKDNYFLKPEELRKYQGVYTLETYRIDITIRIQDGKLLASIPGQPADEFVPVSKDVFSVKGKQGYTVTFKMNGDKPIEFTSIQPNGTFKAVFKND